MPISKESIELAVRNVANWGDTDVLPFPLENLWFHDEEGQVVSLIQELDSKFDNWSSNYPVKYDRCLSSVGHAGYRGVTQIDPIWNAYLLALVIEVGPKIEAARIPIADNQVFAYRFSPDQGSYSLFDTQVSWRQFQEHALKLSSEYSFILSTDISDFYPRVYHHRLENSLHYATNNNLDVCNRILSILSKLSIGGVSYGLPIGGNAARLLAEIILNRTDRLLKSKGIEFCRFVDDYYLFANSEEDLRKNLVYLSDILLRNEGLTLNRSKTRFMTQEEFSRTSVIADPETMDSEMGSQIQEFFKLRLKYDPYSPTADEDYQALRDELESFDIVGMLGRELRKTRIDEALTKQLIRSLRYLNHSTQADAVESLISNLNILHPIFPTVSTVVKAILPELSTNVSLSVFRCVRRLLEEQSYILQVPSNLAFAIRLLADDPSEEADNALIQIYNNVTDNQLIRRDIVLSMARRGAEYWLGDLMRSSVTTDLWHRRALICSSFILGDEGEHWRRKIKSELHQVDKEYMKWIEVKNKTGPWKVPS